MSDHFSEGDRIEWDWGSGTASGKVVQKYTQKHTLKIDGTDVTRDADEENPAYRIEQEDGQTVLKRHSEVREAS